MKEKSPTRSCELETRTMATIIAVRVGEKRSFQKIN